MPAKISKTLMRRLELYLNYLRSLPGGDHNVSAPTIAAALELGEVQVRKDLAKIAGEGRRRTGRSRDQLIREIEKALDSICPVASILIGTEPVSQEFLTSSDFAASGVNVMACFDLTPGKSRTVCGCPLYSINRLETFCKYYDISLGIIAVSVEEAQSVCDGLIACGIQSIWNVSSAQLTVPQGIRLQSGMPEVA